MIKKLPLLFPFFFTSFFTFGQTEKCGTMHVLDEMISVDPSIRENMERIEAESKLWIMTNGRMKDASLKFDDENKNSIFPTPESQSSLAFCTYNNTFVTALAAPDSLNEIISPNPNCIHGGEYITVTDLIAGNVYRISTCGINAFDTQLSIYSAGGITQVAHNDDWCGSQSEILFNPLVSGDYDILIDEYNCLSNILCATLEIELIYVPRSVITIPVIFHVVHFGEAIGVGRNISDAQILSQLDVLNEDFRRMNADINTTPAAFRGGSDDALIEFCLAQQDEEGNPTTGIERILGAQSSYTSTSFNTNVKPTTVWDRNRYLNFWTCNMNLSGYGQFPGGPANTDGVVILYDQVGDVGNVSPPFHLGRTATHEVGHWLNLRHIWGDASGCANDDSIADTPLQSVATSLGSCPTFPSMDACSPRYPGIMFYNQMDYSGDACLTVFTVGQAQRMDAALYGPRLSIQNSPGCLPSTVEINNINMNSILSLGPSPGNGILQYNIKNSGIRIIIRIYNVVGEEISKTILSEGHSSSGTIDLTGQPSGVYFARILAGNTFGMKKLIIGH